MFVTQRIRTKNDINGNARALWVRWSFIGFDCAVPRDVFVEEHGNRPDEARECYRVSDMEVSPSVFNRILRGGLL